MSEAVIDKLSTIDLAALVVIIVVLVIITNALTPWYIKLKNYIIKDHTKEEEEKNLSELVREDHERIKEYEQNRITDRKQSFEIQKQLTDALDNLNTKLEEYCKLTDQRFLDNREREDKRVRAELKDRIGQSYRHYHSIGKWNLMEREALEDLIEEYESAGGSNSFVHSIVEQEMYKWELIE